MSSNHLDFFLVYNKSVVLFLAKQFSQYYLTIPLSTLGNNSIVTDVFARRFHFSSLALEKHLCCHGGWLCVTHQGGRVETGGKMSWSTSGKIIHKYTTPATTMPYIPRGVFSRVGRGAVWRPLCLAWIHPLFLRIDGWIDGFERVHYYKIL